jgi:hypothetical protein
MFVFSLRGAKFDNNILFSLFETTLNMSYYAKIFIKGSN